MTQTPIAMPTQYSIYTQDYRLQQDNHTLLSDKYSKDQLLSNIFGRVKSLDTFYAVKCGDIPPPKEGTTSEALIWIANMLSDARKVSNIWLDPLISSNEDGEVVFEWWKMDRKLTVRIGDDSIEAVKRWGSRLDNYYTDTFVKTIAERKQVWRWLAGNEF